MKLSGRTILITRAAEQAGEFAREIERQGGIPILFPTIEIQPPDSWEECDRAIDRIAGYDGLIFTSTNGVKYFLERCSRRGLAVESLRSKIICAVGDRTARAASALGLAVTVMPEKFSALELAGAIGTEAPAGKQFLFPRGNLGSNAFSGHTDRQPPCAPLFGVDSVVVYRTVQARPGNIDRVRSMLLSGEIDVLTFTSPSTFRNFTTLFSADELREFRPLTKIGAIGPVTVEAICQAGMAVDMRAEESSAESLADSICRYFSDG